MENQQENIPLMQKELYIANITRKQIKNHQHLKMLKRLSYIQAFMPELLSERKGLSNEHRTTRNYYSKSR